MRDISVLMTGIVAITIVFASLLVISVDTFAESNNQINPTQQVSVDDKIMNTITVKLEDGISSSDELH